MAVIELTGLTKSYGKRRGIEGVSFTVEKGEIFGFIGPNGAGKSTTLRTMLNLIYPTAGSATLLGMDSIFDSARIKARVGYVPSQVSFDDWMGVDDLLRYSARFYQDVDAARVDALCKALDVERDKPIRALSHGNKKKVSVVQALMHKPDVVLLDEPTSGLDPLVQRRLFDILRQECARGVTVFLSSHNLAEVQRYCHRVAIIREGRLVEVRTLEQLSGRSRRVFVASPDLPDEVLEELGGAVETLHDMRAIDYHGNMDALVKRLSAFTIEDLRIVEAALEDTFMQYYQDGESGR